MTTEAEQLRNTIQELESKRSILGDAVVDTALVPIQTRLDDITSARVHEEQLKYVSILFVDVKGSTEMAQSLDPEDLMDILGGGLGTFRREVEKHGGQVSRFLGDGFMAIFGIPAAKEDDAVRAVLAGLDIIQAARIYARHVEKVWKIPGYNVRVGINTGQVILGGGLDDENMAVGETIHIASRMESAAPEGGLLITHNTFRHIRGLFKAREQPLLTVKGRQLPVRTYLIEGIEKQSSLESRRGVEGVSTPLIGRESELNILENQYRNGVTKHATSLVTIVGDPGIGKSRLMLAFRDLIRSSQKQLPIFHARANPQMATVPFHLLQEMITNQFNILDGDSAELMQQKLEEGMSDHLGESGIMKTHFIGALLGYDFSSSTYLSGTRNDPKQLHERGLFYLQQMIQSITSPSGGLLIFDDIHWADEHTLEFINSLAASATKGLFILCLTRPEMLEVQPQWGLSSADLEHVSERIYLQPLSETDSVQLLMALIKDVDALPFEIRDMIIHNSDGNPFYIEEFINMLIDEGVFQLSHDGVPELSAEERVMRIKVPATLTAVLQARLDNLPEEERSILQKGSVAGRNFWDMLLAEMDQSDYPPTTNLSSLCNRELIFPHDVITFDNTEEYIFKHAMMQEVAYQSLLKRNRREYHRQIAEWLVNMTNLSGRVESYSAQIAEHYMVGGLDDQAAHWFLRAGIQAKNQGGFSEARCFLDQAMSLIHHNDTNIRWQILLERSEILGILGENDLRRLDIDTMLSIATKTDQPDKNAEAYFRLGSFYYSIGDFNEALDSYNRAIDAAISAGAPEIQSQVMSLKVICLARLGIQELASSTAAEVLSLTRSLIDDTALARTLNNIAIYYDERGDPGQAITLLREQVVINHRSGNQMGEAIGLVNLGYNYTLLGKYELARKTLELSLEISKSVNDRRTAAYTKLNLAMALFRNNVLDDARQLLERTIPELVAMGDLFGTASGHSYMGLVQEASGRLNNATTEYTKAVDLFTKIGALSYASDAQTGIARSLYASGNLADAKEKISQVCMYIEDNGTAGMEFPIWSYKVCAEIYMALEDPEHADRSIKEGYNELMKRSDHISAPEWREAFLSNVPEHLAIIQLYKTLNFSSQAKGESK